MELKTVWSGGIPTFYPTMDQFKDFAKFIESVDKYGMETGIVKVVPPKEWVDSQPPLDETVKSIKIKNPIMQDVNGTGGLYKLHNIEKQRTYNIASWRKVCEEAENQPPAKRGQARKVAKKPKRSQTNDDGDKFSGFNYRFDAQEFTPERCEELERIYWKSLTYSSPMYGADMPGSLFDDDCQVWNVAHLDNILNNLRVNIPGVNTAYLYCGMWKSTFAWHLEDMDLYSINYIHFGAPKYWYSISQKDRHKFYNLMKEMWPQEHSRCKEFLRHKTFHASPALLAQHGIKVNRTVHYQNEFMITFPYGYHSGFNFGYNVAESVNFATEAWLPFGRESKKCRCISDSVGIDVDQLVRWMKGDDALPLTPPHSNDEKDSEQGSEQEPRAKRRKVAPRPRKQHLQKEQKQKPQQQQPVFASIPYPQCQLCPNPGDGDMVKSQAGKHAHRQCARLIPETSLSSQDRLIGLENVPKARTVLRCLQCGLTKGACVQCSEPKCVRAYHATCVETAGVLQIPLPGPRDHFEFLCRFHRPKRPPPEIVEKDLPSISWAYSLLPGEIVQAQLDGSDIFAGRVLENRLSEGMVLLQLAGSNDTIELEWKWLRSPLCLNVNDAHIQRLIKSSAHAVKSKSHVAQSRKLPSPDSNPVQLSFKPVDPVNSTVNGDWVVEALGYDPQVLEYSEPLKYMHYLPQTSSLVTARYLAEP